MNASGLSWDNDVPLRQFLWYIPLVLTLHNIEEALTMPRWVAEHSSEIMSRLPSFIEVQFTSRQLFASLAISTIVPFVATLLCVDGEKRSRKLFLLFLLQMIILLNVFVPHIVATVVMARYNPGLVTAVCCNLPFSLFLFKKAYNESFLSSRELLLLFITAVLVYVPVVAMIHFGGVWIARIL